MSTAQVRVNQVEYGNQPMSEVIREVLELLLRSQWISISPDHRQRQPQSRPQAACPVSQRT